MVKRTRRSASTTARSGSAAPATSAGSRNGKFNANGEHVADRSGKLIWCASEAEAERFRQLLDMADAGRIEALETQPKFDLVVNNVRITGYRADFRYEVLGERGERVRSVVEDVKGMLTPEFMLKHRLFDALQPVPLSIIRVRGKAKHSTRTRQDEAGKQLRTSSGWMDQHWKNRLPD